MRDVKVISGDIAVFDKEAFDHTENAKAFRNLALKARAELKAAKLEEAKAANEKGVL